MKIPTSPYRCPLGRLQPEVQDVDLIKQRGWHDQHILVVTTIEYGDLAVTRNLCVHTPQGIVSPFHHGGSFSSPDPTALRIESASKALDGSVLAPRIHRLKNQQNSMLILGIEALLNLFDLIGFSFG